MSHGKTLEKSFWSYIHRGLLPWNDQLDLMRVENHMVPGTPDVNGAGGLWVEMKCAAQPKDPRKEPPSVPHFTPQQKLWLRKRTTTGKDRCFVFLKLGTVKNAEYILVDGRWAIDNLTVAPLRSTELCDLNHVWIDRVDFAELAVVLGAR